MAPRIKSLLRSGLNSCVAPSSQSCDKPFCNAFMRNGSFKTARRTMRGGGRQECQCIGYADVLVEPHVMQAHPAHIASGAQAHEGDAVAMAGIHVGLDFEH